MRRRGKAARIAIGTLLGAAVLVLLVWAGVWIAITQPITGTSPLQPGERADAKALERHVRFLSEETFPRSHADGENLRRAAEYIAEALARAGARVSFQDFFARGTPQRNVVARLGPDRTPRVVVGAHYDAYGRFPGADDNASGVAGLLELGRLLAGREFASPIELVAYATEEPPFFGSAAMGSAHHAATLAGRESAIEAMICLEMIGYFSERQPLPSPFFRFVYPSSGDFILVAGRWEDRSLVRRVKNRMKGVPELKVQSYCGPTAVGTDLSDQRNYWSVGVPAVMVTDTAFLRNPNYHEAQDTADTLDYERMAAVVDGVAHAVLDLAAVPGRAR